MRCALGGGAHWLPVGWRSSSPPRPPLSHVLFSQAMFSLQGGCSWKILQAYSLDRVHCIIWHLFCHQAETISCSVEPTLGWTRQGRKQLITTSDYLEQLFPNSSLARNNRGLCLHSSISRHCCHRSQIPKLTVIIFQGWGLLWSLIEDERKPFGFGPLLLVGAQTHRGMQMLGAHVQEEHTLQQAHAFAARSCRKTQRGQSCCLLGKGPSSPASSTIPPIHCSGRPAEPGRDTAHVCLYFKLPTVSLCLYFFCY